MLFVAILLLATAPAYAQDVAPGENAARSCYTAAQHHWNTVMAVSPYDTAALTDTYKDFANCASVAIQTGPSENGHHIPWVAEYFADTVGAFYAQEQLIGADRKNRCSHIQLSADLSEQAIEVAPTQAQPALEGLQQAHDMLVKAECK